MQFGSRKSRDNKPDGKAFISQARDDHQQLFETFTDNADEFTSIETYTEALEDQSWQITEQVVKASYRNGIKKGKESRRR